MKFNEMFPKAKWVAPNNNKNYATLIKTFNTTCTNGSIKIIGLGFFECFVNGKKATDELFTPCISDYHHNENHYCVRELGEELSHRVYACEYDISDLLVIGENTLTVDLGGGFYIFDKFGEIKCVFAITLADGNVIFSDKETMFTTTHIISGDIYGEHHDDTYYTNILDKSTYQAVTEIDPVDTEYYIKDCPSDKVMYRTTPILINEDSDNYIYDIGENVSARVVFTTDSDCNVTLTHSEQKSFDNYLDTERIFIQTSTFNTKKSVDRKYYTQFTWNAFRYFSISKSASVLYVEVINMDIPKIAEFISSDEDLNWLFNAYVRTQLSNLHIGVPSDCPQIERRGYTGDGQLTCDTVMTIFDSKKFYQKWMEDIIDCQDKKSGNVQYTAPYAHSGGGPGGWGGAIIEVPYTYYKNYNDDAYIKKMYVGMKRYLNYLEDHSENELVTSSQKGLWCLGDWCTFSQMGAENVNIPESYVNTYFYVKYLYRMIEISNIIGKCEDISEYERLIKIKSDAIMENFFDEERGNFNKNIQCSNVYALDIGLGDERTWNNLVNDIATKGYYDTGIFATDILTKMLFMRSTKEKPYANIAYNLMKNSFGKMRLDGSTSLWEYWTKERSLSHPMFGTPAKYLFNSILGINRYKDDSGDIKIKITPAYIDDLCCIKGSIIINNNTISVEYNKDKLGKIEFTISVDVSDVLFLYNDVSMTLNKGVNKIIL